MRGPRQGYEKLEGGGAYLFTGEGALHGRIGRVKPTPWIGFNIEEGLQLKQFKKFHPCLLLLNAQHGVMWTRSGRNGA